MPSLSIIIPTFNTALYIAEALDSVFAQTFADFEVIVINDGSPDTERLERELEPYTKCLLYLKQGNQGPGSARNTGIRHAQGEYVAFLDSDDAWLPDYLSSQVKLLAETPSLDVLYSDALHFGDPAFAGKTFMQTFPSNGPVTLEALLKEECQVIISCTVARTQAIKDAGLFDASFRGCEDYDLWLRVLYNGGKMAYQRKVLGRYRSRPGSLSRDAAKMSEGMVAVYEKVKRTMDFPLNTMLILEEQLIRARARFDLEAGRSFLAAGEFGRARDSLTKANDHFQRAKLKMAILGLQLAPHWTRKAALAWQKMISGCE